MFKLNIDQKTIKSLFSDKCSDFLIPDYQRPYAWGKQNVKLCEMTSSPLQSPKMTQIKFWYDVANQDTERFSERILRRFFVLNYAPNGMWYYFVSVYFMHHKQDDGSLCEESFYQFLFIIGFVWAYTLTNPGVNALRTPVYKEMVNIVKGEERLPAYFSIG